MIVIGLLSGTSIDAIDAAAAQLHWRGSDLVLVPLGYRETPWPQELRARLLAALPPAHVGVEEICALDVLAGEAFATAAEEAVAELAGGRADLVVSHGQTVYHWVEGGRARGTLQLGQPAIIAEATGLAVISDLRARDIAAGGQGAPLAPTLDALWLAQGDGKRRAALNLGGIANITVVGGPGEAVLAFDTGPANCLLDAAVQRASAGRKTCDRDGRLAQAGRVRADLLARLLAEPYYALPPPKSTGRERFHADYVAERLAGLPPVAEADLLATLTELTAVTVAKACAASKVSEVVVSGGGVRNGALMAALARALAPVPLIPSEARGLPSAGKEAYLMALIGFLSWYGVPAVVAGSTGARGLHVLGRISPGKAPLRLPEPGRWPRRLCIEAAAGRESRLPPGPVCPVGNG